MAFKTEHKKALNTGLPILAGAGVFMWLYLQRRENVKQAAIIAAAVGLVVWLLTRVATKQLLAISERPDHVNVPIDNGGVIDENFAPGPVTKQLRDDLYAPWYKMGVKDGDLWETVAQLSNANLVSIYNEWTDKYFGEHNETLVGAIAADQFLGPHWTNANNIMQRLQQLGCY